MARLSDSTQAKHVRLIRLSFRESASRADAKIRSRFGSNFSGVHLFHLFHSKWSSSIRILFPVTLLADGNITHPRVALPRRLQRVRAWVGKGLFRNRFQEGPATRQSRGREDSRRMRARRGAQFSHFSVLGMRYQYWRHAFLDARLARKSPHRMTPGRILQLVQKAAGNANFASRSLRL